MSVLMHITLFVLAYVTAYWLRFDFSVPADYWQVCAASLPVVLVAKLVAFYSLGLYRSSLRYVSLGDLKRLVVASSVASIAAVVVERFILPDTRIPRSIFVLDWVVTLGSVSAARIAWRTISEHGWPLVIKNGFKRALIVGAGDAGEGLLRELRRRSELKLLPVGFLDDDPRKLGMRMGGVPVLGTVEQAREIAKQYDIQMALIAIPSAAGENMRRIVHALRKADLSFKTLPSIERLLEGKVDVAQLGSVTIEELLRRETVAFDTAQARELIEGRAVAVTGAAGSIGLELCRQVAALGAVKLLMIDWSENGLFYADREMAKTFPDLEALALVADVGDRERILRILRQHRPSVVFHAAAHKHVPLMEDAPSQAARNNVFGTKAVADASVECGVDRFVLISTDKAADPKNVMGMTKRLAEMYVHALAVEKGAGLVAVRFGNVLGSAGSVVPIFREQIERGGPVTVTHPEMTRFFMTIPEAVRLVVQASAIGKQGEILVLDMGEPVKIVDLARDLIELAGLREPEDIRIKYVGIRPGEKLHEELHSADETLINSAHDKILIASCATPDLDGLLSDLNALERAATAGDDRRVSEILASVTVPSRGNARLAGTI